MTIKQAKELIRSENWYKQGAAIKPLYISYPWFCCSDMRLDGKKIKPKYKMVAYFHDSFMDDYISQDSLKNVAVFYYQKQLKDKKFIEKFYYNWHKKFVEKYFKIVREIQKVNLKNLSDRKLINLFKEFTTDYLNVWHEVIFLDGFDFYGEEILKKIIKNENKNFHHKDLEILTTPLKPTFSQKERINIFEIAEKIKIKKTGEIILKEKKIEQIERNHLWLKKELDRHSKNFYWFNNDFASVEYLKPEYYFQSVLDLIKDKEKFKKEKELKLFLKNLVISKKKIIKKYKLRPETENIFYFFSVLGNLRDERKSYNQMAGNALLKFAQEFSQRMHMSLNAVENFYHWEMVNIFKLKKIDFINAENRSKNHFNIAVSPKNSITFTGKNGYILNEFLNKIINDSSDLQGMPAFGGTVKGKVKIIKGKKDFHKMNQGDILIAPNTRPEYLPIMKKASAIITEEGGITCHAAIVSRELKIPAIVGVQGIISVLKDNDMVKVDADKGVVSIIRK